MVIYGIFHKFEVDGGYGNAIYNEELIGITSSMSKAADFISKYQLVDESKLLGEGELDATEGLVYDEPHSDLHMGVLVVRELNEININERPYDDWMLSEALEITTNEKMEEKIKNMM